MPPCPPRCSSPSPSTTSPRVSPQAWSSAPPPRRAPTKRTTQPSSSPSAWRCRISPKAPQSPFPLRAATGSRVKAFLFGAGSGIVEPIFALFGYFLTSYVEALQPWLLAFAAGAMLFVVAEDLIPEAKLAEHPHLGTWGVVSGFVLMMILDVALG